MIELLLKKMPTPGYGYLKDPNYKINLSDHLQQKNFMSQMSEIMEIDQGGKMVQEIKINCYGKRNHHRNERKTCSKQAQGL
jgi:hypothetical protein